MTATCSRPRCDGALHRRGLCGRHWRSGVTEGLYGYTPAEPVARHVATLLSKGWSRAAVAKQAGVSATAVNRCSGRTRMWAPTAKAILAVKVVPFLSGHHGTSPVGSLRRVRALEWMGWSMTEIADRSGVRLTSLLNTFRRGSISTALAARIVEVYDELADTRGPSGVASKRARRRGYAPPAAWDGLDMDDPKVKPEGMRAA